MKRYILPPTLLLWFLTSPVVVNAQQPELLAECSGLSGYTYTFPNAIQPNAGWDSDGYGRSMKIGMFISPATTDNKESIVVMYHTASQGWHFPNNYLTTIPISRTSAAVLLLVAYSDNTAELYMFMLDDRKVAVSLMRHGGILENARLFVGECTVGG